MIRMRQVVPEVYFAEEPIVHIGKPEIEFLTGKVRETPRKRVRVCTHKDVEEKLHEMFVVYLRETYVRPNKHFGKDESLHVLEGAADFVFLDDQGKVIDVVPLGVAPGRQFYCRIPESVYHTFLIRSDRIILHETIQGPFRKADTAFADWSPEEGDAEGIRRYQAELEKAVHASRAAGGPAAR